MGAIHPPKLKPGQTRGQLTVIECVGRHAVNPTNPNQSRLRPSWWYRLRCSCGTEEVVSQEDLSPSGTKTQCIQCTRRRVGRNLHKQGQNPRSIPAELDFARLRW